MDVYSVLRTMIWIFASLFHRMPNSECWMVAHSVRFLRLADQFVSHTATGTLMIFSALSFEIVSRNHNFSPTNASASPHWFAVFVASLSFQNRQVAVLMPS